MPNQQLCWNGPTTNNQFLAARQRFELQLTDPETVVLPLDERAAQVRVYRCALLCLGRPGQVSRPRECKK